MITLPNPDKTTEIQLMKFRQSVVDSIDIEYQRYIKPEDAHRVFDYLIELYTQTNYYTFFTPSNTVSVSDYLFDQSVIRSFILNVTERVINLLPMEVDIMIFIEHTAERYSLTKSSDQATIMPKEIRESIATNKEVLKQCLSKDIWLLIIFYISLYFYQTDIYKVTTGTVK